MRFDDTFDIPIELLEKYDRPGPRYTSYPTAPQFHPGVGPERFARHFSNPKDRQRALSLYIHIPFCEKLCYFCACTMKVTHNRARIAEYLHFLIEEMNIYAQYVGDRPVKQIHWGGGTPTYLTPDEIRMLGEATHRLYHVCSDAEISVEVDPRGISDDHFHAMKEIGVNRISMGVQDFYEPTQRAVNRWQPESLTRYYVELARKMNFKSVNLDFIYGLPYQTPATFEATLERLIDMRPERIAIFNYAHVPWMKKHQKLIPENALPTPHQKIEILKLAIDRLTAAGYLFIGMDHFALPEDELARALQNNTLYRNFQGYSTHAECDILAHGISGISQTRRMYAQNTKDFKAYYAAVKAGRPATERGVILNRDDLLRRDVIMTLMCKFALTFDDIEAKYNIHFNDYFSRELSELDEFILDGLLTMNDREIRVTQNGRLVIRNIAMVFDKYLRAAKAVRFSRTI